MQPLSVLSIRNQREQATKQAFLANSYWESDAVVNPLLTAVGTIRDATSSEVEQQQLTVLERHVSDILRMLGNTMLQVKIEGGLWDFGQQDTNLDELIYGIYGHMSDEYKERYPDVELRLGDRGRTKDVKVDARVARTALACIIDNAMKFTDKGSVTIGYADSQLHDVPSVCFYVEDTGIGIAPEQQGVIFGRYVKLDNRIHGMGIGLYASQQLVGKAGGAIGVKSSPGQGTRMTVELPIGPADLLSI